MEVETALKAHPQDWTWIHARGRAHLIEFRLEDAVKTLTEAVVFGGNSSELLTDLGIAYAQRAESEGEPVDWTHAIEFLSSALTVDPNNVAARFNRGVVFAKLFLWESARADFEQCSKLAEDPGWLKEILAHRDQSARVLDTLSPEGIHPTTRDELELALFLREIRVDAIQEQEIHELGQRLKREHGDSWLADLVELPAGVVSQRALRILSRMASIRAKSRLEQYAEIEPEIEWLSGQQLPPPLQAWKYLETAFRASHSPAIHACAVLTGRNDAVSPRYPWFRSQLAMELSSCLAGQGQRDRSNESTKLALDVAREAKYRITSVRANGFLLSHLVGEGRYREAVSQTVPLLAELSQGEFPLDRGHQLYRNLQSACERLNRWNAAWAASRMSNTIAHRVGLRSLETLGLLQESELALRSGSAGEAKALIERAGNVAAAVPEDPDQQQRLLYASTRIKALEGDYSFVASNKAAVLAHNNMFMFPAFLTGLIKLESAASDWKSVERDSSDLIRRLKSIPNARLPYRYEYRQANESLLVARVELNQPIAALEAFREHVLFDEEAPREWFEKRPQPPPGTVQVTLAPAGERIAVFVERGHAVDVHWAEQPVDQVLSKLRRVISLSSRPSTDASMIRRLASDLGQALFGGLTPSDSGSILRVDTVGELRSLPLRLLLSQLKTGVHFEDFAFGSAAASLETSSGSGCPSPRHQLTLIQANASGPEVAGKLGPLPGLEAEALAIRHGIGGGIHLISGLEATPTVLDEAIASSKRVHFSGHAKRRGPSIALVAAPGRPEEGPERSRGYWKMDRATRACAELVFFAACSTGAFHETESVLPGQVSRAALLAGVKHAVASLWDIDSIAASRFSEVFYREIGRGASVARALQTAANSLSRSKEFAHPYYWAMFELYTR